MFYFYVKTYQADVWTVLCFLVIQDTVQPFFLRLGELSYFFPSLSMLLTFYPLCFQYCETTLGVLSREVFCQHCSSGTFSSFFWSQSLSSFMSSSPLLSPSGCPRLSPTRARSTQPGQLFLLHLIFAPFIFHFQPYHSSSAGCTSIFDDQFLLSGIDFYKMSRGFITRRQGGNWTILYPLLSVSQPSNRCAVTNHWTDFERSDVIGPWS